DSICSNPTDAEHDAPGADDDASGVAAVLEMARVMSLYRFNAHVLFAAVAGEEQGLLGSGYLAEQLKKDGWQVEAMFTNDIIGSSTGMDGTRDPRLVRVFSEGVSSAETEPETRIRRSVGGENDAPSRQLGRFVKEAADKLVRGIQVKLVF